MALRAHAIPGLVQARPVQWIARFDMFIRIQVKPALLVDIPGDGQTLQAASRERD